MTGQEKRIILDHSERERRKAVWNNMTEEERQKVEEKKKKIIEWAVKEEDIAFERIKSEGGWTGGLDGYYPELVAVHDEYKKRLHELLVSIFGEEI